jgi:hypothetical protein
MVFEHGDEPDSVLTVIARVLSKDGMLIFHTPNTYGYATILARMIPERLKSRLVHLLQRREEEDVFPAYYRLNSPASIRKTAAESGFKVNEIRLVCSSAQVVVFPPIAFLELIWIRFLLSKTGRPLRTNIITILEKARDAEMESRIPARSRSGSCADEDPESRPAATAPDALPGHVPHTAS